MEPIMSKRKVIYCTKVYGHPDGKRGVGFVTYRFEDGKRMASNQKVYEDAKGRYFQSKGEKYYLHEI